MTVSTPDPTRCPICGESNQCAMAKADGHPQSVSACWCVQVQFTAQVLERVPLEARSKACICHRCASEG